MKPEIKAMWIEALRSGKYKQANGVLRDKDARAYCCLGVLCRVVGATFEDYSDEEACWLNVPVRDGKNLACDEDQELSSEFMAEIGMMPQEQGVLIEMNDEGVPFTEIADHIERNL